MILVALAAVVLAAVFTRLGVESDKARRARWDKEDALLAELEELEAKQAAWKKKGPYR